MTAAPATRFASPAQIRAWLGLSGGTILRLRKAGRFPDPLPGTRKYDVEAVKRALDQAQGTEAKSETAEERLIARARRWGGSR
jgi:hypothetical protein